MRTRTIIILLIVVCLGIGGIYGWNEYHRTNKSLSGVTADYTVSASQFLQEFEKSDSLTDQKYFGKIIAVNGKIKKIEKDPEGSFTVVLGSSPGMSAVRCSMDSAYDIKVATLKEGDDIIIKGYFTGYQNDETGLLGSDVKLNRAVIQDFEK